MDLAELRRLASSSSSCTVDNEVSRSSRERYAEAYPITDGLTGDELRVWEELDEKGRRSIQSDRAYYGGKLRKNISFHDILGIRMFDGRG